MHGHYLLIDYVAMLPYCSTTRSNSRYVCIHVLI